MVGKLRWPALGLGILLAFSVNVAEAQVNATVVLKSGERHTGRNVGYRMDRREVSVRTSQHEEPRVNVDQVAYIDFGGTPEPPQVTLTGTQQAVVLRDGNVLRGQVVDLGHVDPADEQSDFLVTVRTEAGEERRLPVAQVGRVYFSSPSAVATTGKEEPQVAAAPGEIVVSSRQQWTPTGMTVRNGERVRFEATGEVQLSDDAKDIARPAGALSQRTAPGSPLPQNFAGALIGRIGTGEPFPIGDQTAVTMPATGQLFLGVNDDVLEDNRGEFRVKIQRGGGRQ